MRARTSSRPPSTRLSLPTRTRLRTRLSIVTTRVEALPAVHDTGSGETVLFLHAFSLDASQWDHQVAALSGNLRCVRVDLWGCGESPAAPGTEPSLDDVATAVLTALDSRGIDRFAVVGLRWGAIIPLRSREPPPRHSS